MENGKGKMKIKRFAKFMAVLMLVIMLALFLVGPALAGVDLRRPAGASLQGDPPSFLEIVAEAVVIAGFMATVANRLVEGLITPLFEKFKWDKFYLMYAAWLVGGGLVWVTHVNIFAPYVPDPLIGQILTALVSGGGANFIYDLFKK